MNKEIDWQKVKNDLKEEYQIEDWNEWISDKRVSNYLDALISIRILVEKQLKEIT